MNNNERLAAYVSLLMCDACRQIDIGDEHWIIACTQSPNHEGPHVGMITWDDE
jgi:hypothetical protein